MSIISIKWCITLHQKQEMMKYVAPWHHYECTWWHRKQKPEQESFLPVMDFIFCVHGTCFYFLYREFVQVFLSAGPDLWTRLQTCLSLAPLLQGFHTQSCICWCQGGFELLCVVMCRHVSSCVVPLFHVSADVILGFGFFLCHRLISCFTASYSLFSRFVPCCLSLTDAAVCLSQDTANSFNLKFFFSCLNK